MSTPSDSRIDAYIAKSASFAQPILRHLRSLVHRACPGATETIKWSMPHFEHGGSILCGMAAFKAHCSFGFWHHQMNGRVAAAGIDAQDGMGSFGRITSPKDLPSDKTLLRLIGEAAKLNESGAPARPRPASRGPKKALPMPTDLAAALKKNPRAAAVFTDFAPSHRKEYIQWIVEAKRDETRQKRLATTIEWLEQGKARNWKYERC
jgi:hypothetical protein